MRQRALFTEQARHDKQKREERQDKNDRAIDAASEAASIVLATTKQLATFNQTLDTYDTATVEALMRNERELAEVQARIDAMLVEAHVMEDGRRVFKTEDGTQVFDEHGKEVTNLIDPMEIPDTNPTWESYHSSRAEEHFILDARRDILDYQQRLDEARDRAASGELTQDELEQLEASLAEDMPEQVRAALPSNHPLAQTGPQADTTITPTQDASAFLDTIAKPTLSTPGM